MLTADNFPRDYSDAVSFVKELSRALLTTNPELDDAKARENLECVLGVISDVHPFSMEIGFTVSMMYKVGLKIVGIVSGPCYGEITEIISSFSEGNMKGSIEILNYN